MSVLPVGGSIKLLPTKPNPTPRFVNVASIVASTHKRPETLPRRLTIDEHSEKLTAPAGRTAMEAAAAASMTRRLERVAESIIESEKQKFEAKFRGEKLSEEEMRAVESMSAEIVGKFFERPINYLESGRYCCHGDFNDRMKDLESLTKILEQTCFGKAHK